MRTFFHITIQYLVALATQIPIFIPATISNVIAALHCKALSKAFRKSTWVVLTAISRKVLLNSAPKIIHGYHPFVEMCTTKWLAKEWLDQSPSTNYMCFIYSKSIKTTCIHSIKEPPWCCCRSKHLPSTSCFPFPASKASDGNEILRSKRIQLWNLKSFRMMQPGPLAKVSSFATPNRRLEPSEALLTMCQLSCSLQPSLTLVILARVICVSFQVVCKSLLFQVGDSTQQNGVETNPPTQITGIEL